MNGLQKVSLLTLMTLLCGSIFGLFVLRNLLLCGGNLWKSATFSVAPGFWGSFARLDFLVAAHKGLLLSSRNTDPPCTMASSKKYCPKLQKSFYHKRKYLKHNSTFIPSSENSEYKHYIYFTHAIISRS